jgi:outer membrane protein assembly factor BamB
LTPKAAEICRGRRIDASARRVFHSRASRTEPRPHQIEKPASGKVLWEEKMAGDLRKSGGQLASPPAYAGGKLVVGTLAGAIEAYDAKSGVRAFTIPIGEPIRFQPVLAAGRVFVGTERGTLVSVATGDASLDRWTMWGGGARHNGAD